VFDATTKLHGNLFPPLHPTSLHFWFLLTAAGLWFSTLRRSWTVVGFFWLDPDGSCLIQLPFVFLSPTPLGQPPTGSHMLKFLFTKLPGPLLGFFYIRTLDSTYVYFFDPPLPLGDVFAGTPLIQGNYVLGSVVPRPPEFFLVTTVTLVSFLGGWSPWPHLHPINHSKPFLVLTFVFPPHMSVKGLGVLYISLCPPLPGIPPVAWARTSLEFSLPPIPTPPRISVLPFPSWGFNFFVLHLIPFPGFWFFLFFPPL